MGDQSENKTVKWGYILQAEDRPSLRKQRESISCHEIDTSQYGPIWHDVFEGTTTRPRKHLTAREDMLGAIKPGDTLVVPALSCLGLSPVDIDWFLKELAAKQVDVIVNGGSTRIKAGTDTTNIIDQAKKAQRNQHMKRYRKTKS
ncbi:recombinase family protein [Pseudovibrio ascidiaceicola]|uniref:recombinase family protein n=1 Tax=Pseudovibrio ascidiaceicola TaxID=285279 RepID=UPI003D3628A5